MSHNVKQWINQWILMRHSAFLKRRRVVGVFVIVIACRQSKEYLCDLSGLTHHSSNWSWLIESSSLPIVVGVIIIILLEEWSWSSSCKNGSRRPIPVLLLLQAESLRLLLYNRSIDHGKMSIYLSNYILWYIGTLSWAVRCQWNLSLARSLLILIGASFRFPSLQFSVWRGTK